MASRGSGEECLERLERAAFDLILLDVWLKKMDGLQMLEQIQTVDSAPMVVMISGHGNIETAVRATKLGAFDFVEKPLSLGKVDARGAQRARIFAPGRRKSATARGTGREKSDSRQQRSDEGAAAADRADGADKWARADLWRERHRQGIGCAGASREQLRAGRCRLWK